MDRGAWWVPVHGFLKSWTRLSDFHIQLVLEMDSPTLTVYPSPVFVISLALKYVYHC